MMKWVTPASRRASAPSPMREPTAHERSICRRVAALGGAVLVEDRRLLAEHVDRAERVPDVPVAGDELERALDAAAADQDRDALAQRRRVEPAQAVLDPRERLLERGERVPTVPNS